MTLPETKSSLTAWERWEMASFDAGATDAASAVKKQEAAAENEELAHLRDAASAEGYAAGHTSGFADGRAEGMAEGLAAGKADAEAAGRLEAEAIARVLTTLESRIEALDQTVADDLVALSLAVARQVVRETIAIRPEVLLSVIREALAQLPLQHAAIHLHPEDASLARSRAGDQLAHAGHRIHEDPKLARGDVVIDVGGSHLDATVSTRWRRVVESLGHDAPWIDSPEP